MEPATAFDLPAAPPLLPEVFARWFAGRGWAPRAHQLELLAKARAGRSTLLIAPTGGGKTLAGFLPTLVELYEKDFSNARHVPLPPRSGGEGLGVGGNSKHRSAVPPTPDPSPPLASLAGGGERTRFISTGRDVRRSQGLHTLYISPLKALAVDIARNLEIPVKEMGLNVRLETRTGDTPASKRQRQRRYPPDILLTTPEQLALLLATADAPYLFGTLRRVVLDELHSLVTSKRGDLLSLGLARLYALAPQLTTVGLSATVATPDDLCRFLVPQSPGREARADLVMAEAGAPPHVAMLDTDEHLPWAGHSARHALGEIYASDQAPQDHAGVRQHPQPGGVHFPDAVADERRQPRHRAASRLARRRAAPQGRGCHERRALARGGVHLFARPRRRLGRRRSGDQCRRAQRRLAAAAADRPLQPPARRAVESGAGAGQPLRSAGVPRRARCRGRKRAGHAAFAHRRARRAGPAHPRPRLRRTVPGRRALRRSARRRALHLARARRLRRRGRFRRHRRLRAESLRALRQDQARYEMARTAAGASPIRAWRNATA